MILPLPFEELPNKIKKNEWKSYIEMYPDLIKSDINNEKKALSHWYRWGFFENRIWSNSSKNMLDDRHIPEIDKYKLYQKYDNVILTCYFTSKLDPQRKIKIQDNYFKYIKFWYKSLLNHNLHGIIFYDNLSQEFIKQYQTDKIIFIKSSLGKLSINDERFIIWYKYLLRNPYKYVLMTDVSDVQINKNPFDFISKFSKDKIFIGTNTCHLDTVQNTNSIWFKKREKSIQYMNKFLKKQYFYNEYQLYNPGLFGGHYNIVMEMLLNVSYIESILNHKNYNLIIFNYLIHTYLIENYDSNHCTKYVITGQPFNSIYKKYEQLHESQNYLIHK
tara:strand:+ start:2849 stop:3841 length:993 start_codon:yes stop_codon:yes gene_type:complete